MEEIEEPLVQEPVVEQDDDEDAEEVFNDFEDNDGGDDGGDNDDDDYEEESSEEDSDEDLPGGGGGNDNGVIADGNDARPGAFTPGLGTKGILRYDEKKSHAYLYKQATAPLEEEKYDCKPEGFFQFHESLKERAVEFGWNDPEGIFWVRPSNSEQPINILENYGSITLKAIKKHELTYWDNGSRKCQDARMLYMCIMNSLSVEGKAKLNINSQDYSLGPRGLPSGLCLFKILVRESYLDSNATTGMIREQLSELDSFIPQVGHSITQFNNHVKMLLKALHARGEKTMDLLTYLFKAYAVCKDEEFVKYIRDLQTKHEMGGRKQRLTSEVLMHQAEKKYKIMVTTKTWEAPTPAQEQLIAMQTTLDQMKQKLKDKKSVLKEKKRQSNEKNDSTKKGKKVKYEKKELPAWMDKPPETDKMHEPVMWNGKDWHWCCKETGGKCPGAWRVHTPKMCKGTAGKGKVGGGGGQKKKITLKQTVVEDDYGTEFDDEEMLEGGYFSD